jgi:metal-responsive CopG/Arc/MetJ family transcriptional regulator
MQPSRKKPGPKKTGQGVQIQVRMHEDLLTLLDGWSAEQGQPQPSRPEAIRRLLRQALDGTKQGRQWD